MVKSNLIFFLNFTKWTVKFNNLYVNFKFNNVTTFFGLHDI